MAARGRDYSSLANVRIAVQYSQGQSAKEVDSHRCRFAVLQDSLGPVVFQRHVSLTVRLGKARMPLGRRTRAAVAAWHRRVRQARDTRRCGGPGFGAGASGCWPDACAGASHPANRWRGGGASRGRNLWPAISRPRRAGLNTQERWQTTTRRRVQPERRTVVAPTGGDCHACGNHLAGKHRWQTPPGRCSGSAAGSSGPLTARQGAEKKK
jgi:hypothetical protein